MQLNISYNQTWVNYSVIMISVKPLNKVFYLFYRDANKKSGQMISDSDLHMSTDIMIITSLI